MKTAWSDFMESTLVMYVHIWSIFRELVSSSCQPVEFKGSLRLNHISWLVQLAHSSAFFSFFFFCDQVAYKVKPLSVPPWRTADTVECSKAELWCCKPGKARLVICFPLAFDHTSNVHFWSSLQWSLQIGLNGSLRPLFC